MKDREKRAVLVLPGTEWADDQPVPAELFHLVDRPFIHHVVEAIAASGYGRIDVVLSTAPELFEACLGDGCRWGVELTYHLARDPSHPYERLAALDLAVEEASDERVLMAHGCALPASVPACSEAGWDDEAGWGTVPGSLLRRIPARTTKASLSGWLRSHGASLGDSEGRDAHPLLDARTARDFLRSTHRALDGQRPDLLTVGQQRNGCAQVAWNARIHPDATITGPVFLGENSWVGPGAQVGPFAVIGSGAMVDRGAQVVKAVVEPDSYVGEGLRLESAAVRKGWLLNAQLCVAIRVSDPLMLSGTEGPVFRSRLLEVAERAAAGVAVVMSAPALLATMAFLAVTRSGPVVFRPEVEGRNDPRDRGTASRRAVRLFTFDPSFGRAATVATRSRGLGDLLLRVLPGMVSVARGDLAIVGVEPRTPDAVEALPDRWRDLYRRSRPGLITEAETEALLTGDADVVFAAEALFARKGDLTHRLRILAGYAAVLIRGIGQALPSAR
jgi:lipopolysaccharide/colanic/teichoic acid biosynthesis glycosyltransferase